MPRDDGGTATGLVIDRDRGASLARAPEGPLRRHVLNASRLGRGREDGPINLGGGHSFNTRTTGHSQQRNFTIHSFDHWTAHEVVDL